MKMLNCATFFLLTALLSVAVADKPDNLVWHEDFEAAKASAVKLDRPVLADFTGSDWCPPCIRLKNDVFLQPAFKTFADEHVVLFVADFPRRKEQSETLKAQNRKLQQKYNIRGFPTILLLDAQGKELARTGFRPGGVQPYIEHLKELLAQKK